MIIEADRVKGLEGGNIRLVAFRSAATHILPIIIAKFCRQFPLIKVSVTEADEHSEIENIMRSGQADIGLVHLPCSDEFETWEIFQDKYVVLLPRSLNLNQKQLTWKQLATYSLILSNIESCSRRIRQDLQRSQNNLNIAYEMREDSSIIGMAMGGLGAAIMPQLAAEPIPEQLLVYSLPTPLENNSSSSA